MIKKYANKKIIFLLTSIVLLFGLYISLNIYQAENISVVPIEDIKSISVSKAHTLSSDTLITGEIKVNRFEAITHINKEKYDDVLYIIIHKQPSFYKENVFSFNLDGVDAVESVNRISIVSGDVYVEEGGTRGYSLGDLKKLAEQKVIWEK